MARDYVPRDMIRGWHEDGMLHVEVYSLAWGEWCEIASVDQNDIRPPKKLHEIPYPKPTEDA